MKKTIKDWNMINQFFRESKQHQLIKDWNVINQFGSSGDMIKNLINQRLELNVINQFGSSVGVIKKDQANPINHGWERDQSN